jgi:hypothetical protein
MPAVMPTAEEPQLVVADPTASDDSSEEAIRQRAYELYLARGGAVRAAAADWLAAERDLRPRNVLGGSAAAPTPES